MDKFLLIAGLFGLALMLVRYVARIHYQKGYRHGHEKASATFRTWIAADFNSRAGFNLRLLTGESWRDPLGKIDFMRAVFSGRVPTFLWYSLGSQILDDETTTSIQRIFWDGKEPEPGDLMVAGYADIGSLLRVRQPYNLVSQLYVDGEACPLYEAEDHVGSEAFRFNFMNSYPERAATA